MKIFVTITLALLLSGCGLTQSTLATSSLSSLEIEQDVPVLVDHPDLDSEPNSTGAVLFFAADLRDETGTKIGELIGQVTTFDVTIDGVDEVDNFREMVFNMEDGMIVVLGAAQYVAGTEPDFADDNAPVTAVIVGGTDTFVGVRGTVTTTKRANGTFLHKFTFVD